MGGELKTLAEITASSAGDEVNKVVNNLAGKIGVAVDKVAPVADKVVQEISYRGLAMAALWLALWVVVLVICWVLVRRMYKICNGNIWIPSHNNPPSGWGWPIVFFSIGGIAFSILSIYNIITYVNQATAPTLYLIEVLFNAGSVSK